MELLRAQLLRAQQRMKTYVYKNRTKREFAVGKQVLLKLQPYAQQSVVSRPYPKLSYKYFGPFSVLESIGKVAYKLQLPDTARIHLVFHVSQLKPFLANYTPVYSELPSVSNLSTVTPVPEEILHRRLVRKGNTATPQVLIKWAHVRASCATWEDYYVVRACYPEAALWEEEAAQGSQVSYTPHLRCMTTRRPVKMTW
jgi:hypothetical protein